MKTSDLVSLSLILTMFSLTAVNFARKEDKQPNQGCGQKISRYQPWGPGWIRPSSSCTLDKNNFRVEPTRNLSSN